MASFENSVVVAKNVNFDLAAAKPHLGILDAQGKLPIGTGNSYPTPEILGGNIISPDGSITVGYSSPNITLQTAQTPQVVIKGPIVDLLTLGNTNIFAFPAQFVLTGIIFIATSVTGVPNSDYQVNFGWTAPNYNDIAAPFTQGGPGVLNYEAGVFLPATINNFSTIPASQTVVARVVSIDTGAAVYMVRVDLMGYYY